ncbi:MAG: biopolymer transporter ExbD [Deltaproteobacteria bacterium]|nr:biopolymer transporter ExbD [Deltaproteobacteria bacterium]
MAKRELKEGDSWATMGQVKSMARRRLRRQPEIVGQGLNIYPMIDMMTILLVFMVMQFSASSAATIQASPELQIPYSTSTDDMGEAVSLLISRSGITVDGEHVVGLRNGMVDPSDKRGGSTGFLITPLARKLADVRDMQKAIARRNPRRPFGGEVQIVADGRTPFRTLSEVIYTLGQNEFSQLHFVANKSSVIGSRSPIAGE